MNARYIILLTISLVLCVIAAEYSTVINDSVFTPNTDSTVIVEKKQETSEEYFTETRGQLHPFNPSRWTPDWVLVTSGGVGRYYDKEPRRDRGKSPRWYYNDAISKGGRIPTSQELWDWANQWGRNNVGGSADVMYVASDSPLDLRWHDKPGCSCDGDLNEDGAITTGNNGGVIYLWETLYASVIMTKDTALHNPGNQDYICYSRYKPYNISVKVGMTDDLWDAKELNLYLDYNHTNATLNYNWMNQTFYKTQDPDGHVELLLDDCTVTNDGVEFWWVNFTVMFNFTFPHERLVDCYVETLATNGDDSRDFFPWLFRVENDFEMDGTPELVGEYQGRLEEGDWIRGNETVTLSNLTVLYSNTFNVYPDDKYFDVTLTDSVGNVYWDNVSSSEEVRIDFPSRNLTDLREKYYITITNLPGRAICMSNFTFPVTIDAEAPSAPFNVICHADSFRDKETENTDQTETFVTWEEVEDFESQLKGYYYSLVDNSGTDNGTFLNKTEVHIENLMEGDISVFVWSIDNVGNIGSASISGIRVDLTPPVFTDLIPLDGSWFNHSDVECSLTIIDNGSGVDASTIEYSVSSLGSGAFLQWIPAWLPYDQETANPIITYNFPEGENNYIKWRAKDVSENGFVESNPVNVKIDITPVKFSSEITPQIDWYSKHEISSTIFISDTGCGVDTDRIQARISTSGSSDFSKWILVDTANITKAQGGYEISVTFQYAEGSDNYLMFRGTDLVGNPFTLSKKFNLKIDTTSVYFSDFNLDEDIPLDVCEVDCLIIIRDNGSGVDPSSVEYSISTEGPEEKSFSPWKKVSNVVSGNPTQATLQVEFEWGRGNYIRWRANDMLDTGFSYSETFQIWINSKPELTISSPENRIEVYSDESVLFDATLSEDYDGDNLSFYWSSNIDLNRSLGNLSLFKAKLAVGNHSITLYVSDGHDNNISKKFKINVREKVVIPVDDGGSDGGIFSASGGDDSLFWLIIGGAGVLFLLILLIFFIVLKKKKKKKEEQKSTGLSAPAYYGPNSSPYPQGYYQPQPIQQRYHPQAHGIPPSMGYGQTQARPQPSTAAPMQYPSTPQAQPQLAQYNQSPSQTPSNISPNTTGYTGDISYSLPAFSTDQGPQNLTRMALPPGPAPDEPATSFQPAAPSVEVPIAGPTELQFQGITPASPVFPEINISPPTPVPESISPTPPVFPEIYVPPQTPVPVGASPSLPSVPGTNTPAVLDEIFSGAPPEGPPAPPTPPIQGTDVQEIMMQCHSCGNSYPTYITSLPAVVTCTHCQTQGRVESL
ncbi:MAG: hypothetical protein QF682_12705 [Candidatus Thermoplasmatota archaeon]|nr:hypothetical protein [Candidatus Thermoplasmatota archaeon]